MGKINLLDSSVYNVIAAGEVVDRPASIVKELVENSIDAGATTITVEIQNGGIDCICVTDNGCGIAPEDVPKAFLAHATSKIKSTQDLEQIATLGFRGEALASIAAVAEVTLRSRTPEADLGYGIQIDNGRKIDEGDVGCSFGTSVTVKNLFACIPARRKFLSKPHIEEAEISNIVTRFILANYTVSFKYISNGKIVLQSDGSGMESAIYAAYGREFSENVSPVDYSMSDIRLTGYICKPFFTKHNRNFQTLIINGRYVVNSDISYQVYDCYQNYLMKRQYPVYVLYLRMPFDLVDVNVHPNKLEVKFAAPLLIKRIVRDAVKAVLSGSVHEVSELAEKAEPDDDFGVGEPIEEYNSAEKKMQPPTVKSDNFVPTSVAASSSLKDVGSTTFLKTFYDFPYYAEHNISSAEDKPIQKSKTAEKERITEQTRLELFGDKKYTIRGVLFNTYIVVEQDNFAYFIDQHAAHEKLLYDRLAKVVDAREVAMQQLLIPYNFDLSYDDSVLLSENLEIFYLCGFEIIKKSDTAFSLLSVPAMCAGMDVPSFLNTLLTTDREALRQSTFIKDTLMQTACKAAVKGRDALSENELEILMNSIVQENISLYCPHGRPIAVRISKNELEKWFKRVV